MSLLDNRFIVLVMERKVLEWPERYRKETVQFFLTMQHLIAQGKPESSALLFSGYDHDPREIWQIPECCLFCNRIMKDHPHYYKIADDMTKGMLLYATAKPNPFTQGKWLVNEGWAAVIPEFKRLKLERTD